MKQKEFSRKDLMPPTRTMIKSSIAGAIVLFLALLKLKGIIAWSWVWVITPFWILDATFAVTSMMGIILYTFMSIFAW